MGKTAQVTAFLKECMADSLLKLMKDKPFSKITVNEIADGANVNRSTWFRNFTTKTDALTFKLVQSWERWADEHDIRERPRYTQRNAQDFFRFVYEIRHVLRCIIAAGLQSTIYDAFYQIMKPDDADAAACYRARFYSFGLFGLLNEWARRDFRESPEEMMHLFIHMLESTEIAAFA